MPSCVKHSCFLPPWCVDCWLLLLKPFCTTLHWHALSFCFILIALPRYPILGRGGLEHQAVQRVAGVPDASTLRLAVYKRRRRARMEGSHPGKGRGACAQPAMKMIEQDKGSTLGLERHD